MSNQYKNSNPIAGKILNSDNEEIELTPYIYLQKTQMGQFGGKYSGAATITPNEGYNFAAIQIIEETTFGTIEGNITNLSEKTIPVGTIIVGIFTSIEISSGSIIAYNGKI